MTSMPLPFFRPPQSPQANLDHHSEAPLVGLRLGFTGSEEHGLDSDRALHLDDALVTEANITSGLSSGSETKFMAAVQACQRHILNNPVSTDFLVETVGHVTRRLSLTTDDHSQTEVLQRFNSLTLLGQIGQDEKLVAVLPSDLRRSTFAAIVDASCPPSSGEATSLWEQAARAVADKVAPYYGPSRFGDHSA